MQNTMLKRKLKIVSKNIVLEKQKTLGWIEIVVIWKDDERLNKFETIKKSELVFKKANNSEVENPNIKTWSW